MHINQLGLFSDKLGYGLLVYRNNTLNVRTLGESLHEHSTHVACRACNKEGVCHIRYQLLTLKSMRLMVRSAISISRASERFFI